MGSLVSRRPDTRSSAAALVLTAAILLLAAYSALRPSSTPPGMPNHVRVQLQLDTGGSGAVLEAEGEQEQVQAVLEAARAEGSEGDASMLRQQQAVEQQLQEVEESGARQQQQQQQGAATQQQEVKQQQQQQGAATQQQEVKQQQQQQEPSKQQAGAGAPQRWAVLSKPPVGQAKSAAQRSAEFAHFVSQCYYTADPFACLSRQADVEPGPGQFRFPHFMVVGFQKCATTSLFHHLSGHPQIQNPGNKEPEFYTRTCAYNAMRCMKMDQRDYLREILSFKEAGKKNFTVAGFEGSTHYVLEGRWLAAQLHDLFPWLKIVVSMREPISQAIAMIFHNIEHNRTPPCYTENNNKIYKCVLEDLDYESNYARAMRPWLKHFPLEQVHMVQYENITSGEGMAPALRGIKRFLGIKPALPDDDLGLYNFRHQRKHKQGWRMTRAQYLDLVAKARRNAQDVAALVRQGGWADADGWVENWEKAWQQNLDESCEPEQDGICMIKVT
ncbi:sulfotransferase [Micractinium conductrix]|uniref:Sulfotransferase n=1 Tax=Micractinium conductrix TaxID=554055 RepID=A0A2P6V365_9CHLO|nr:sulfotransferase [Micractinium conductrix]|eukprot:PSC68517.1 sulfotransferase [Micractinium conductrix]